MTEFATDSELFDHAPVSADVHPFPDLCTMSPDAIYRRYCEQQHLEFSTAMDVLTSRSAAAFTALPMMRDIRLDPARFGFVAGLDSADCCDIFNELHAHVLGHPVWTHPFFTRFADGAFDGGELEIFLGQYLNQIKNTRQCVSLVLGRLHSLGLAEADLAHERVSEQTQVVLAGILADEYGVAAHPTTGHSAQDITASLCWSITHVDLFRRMFSLIETPPGEQDHAMLPQVADNVLIQRAVAEDPAYDILEGLASIGMAMEWGVPIIFSQLLRGILRYGDRVGVTIEPAQVEVLTGHVTQDIEHAVGVMLAALLWLRTPGDIERVKQVTNVVMAGRYQMMSAIYGHVFAEECAPLTQETLDPAYHINDRRIVDAMGRARARIALTSVDHPDYANAPLDLPFAR